MILDAPLDLIQEDFGFLFIGSVGHEDLVAEPLPERDFILLLDLPLRRKVLLSQVPECSVAELATVIFPDAATFFRLEKLCLASGLRALPRTHGTKYAEDPPSFS